MSTVVTQLTNRMPGRLRPAIRLEAEDVPFDAIGMPAHQQGFDIFATAAAAAGVPHRELFWRSGHYQVARIDDWKLQMNERPPGSAWLLDLKSDPTEQANLAAREPERVAAMRRALAAPGDEYIYWPN
jgi:hypothetical protein